MVFNTGKNTDNMEFLAILCIKLFSVNCYNFSLIHVAFTLETAIKVFKKLED